MTYVNEVIAINSPLCGSLRAWLAVCNQMWLSLDLAQPPTAAGAARAGALQEQVWDARGWVAGFWGFVSVLLFFFLPEWRRRKEGGEGKEGGERRGN